MPRCSVCDRMNPTLLCPHCGFDGSCDYDQYPTLGTLRKQSLSVQAQKFALSTPSPVHLNAKDRLSGLSVLDQIRQEQHAPENDKKIPFRKADTGKNTKIQKLVVSIWVLGILSMISFAGFALFSDIMPLFLCILCYFCILIPLTCLRREHPFEPLFRSKSLNRACWSIYALLQLGFLAGLVGFYVCFSADPAYGPPIPVVWRMGGLTVGFNGLYFGLWAWGMLFRDK